MRGSLQRGAAAAAIVAAMAAGAATSAEAANQAILGSVFKVKNPSATDATKRKVTGAARESGSANTIVGDPVANGAVVQIIANGATDSDHTLNMPKEGWRALGSGGFKYSGKIPGGAVTRALIKKSGSGAFSIKLAVSAKGYPVVVVPPNAGTDGGFILKITGGDNYCVAFGGAAGGNEQRDDATRWYWKRPTAEGCPVPENSPTTTTTVPVTTTLGGTTTTLGATTTTLGGTTTTVGGTTTTVGGTTTTLAGPTTTLPPFPFNDCGGSPFPTCDGTGCPEGFECAIVFAEPTSSDGGCACVAVGPDESGCRGVPPGACPVNPVCPQGSTCFANPFFGGGCGCSQCSGPFCP